MISFIIFTVYRRRGIYRVENFCDIKKTRIYLQAWNDLNPVPLLPAFLKTFFRGWFLISDRDKVSAGCACLFVNIRGRIHKKRERTEAMQTVRIFKKKLYKKREFKKRVCSRQQYARKEVIIYQVCVNKSLEIKRGRRGRRGRRRKKKENNHIKRTRYERIRFLLAISLNDRRNCLSQRIFPVKAKGRNETGARGIGKERAENSRPVAHSDIKRQRARDIFWATVKRNQNSN